MTAQEKTAEFLKIAEQFKLGHLITESFHPKTAGLSALVKSDITRAQKLLQEVDGDALKVMASKETDLWDLYQSISETLTSGNKIFMCGCGATGRLSLVLETLHHQKFGASEKVISFMAGGDFALIKSVESFEDRTDYGERQLLELGFGPGDLLLASTEGGETPFVIGATNAAANLSSRRPYFLYCNPDSVLEPIKRSQEVIANPRIQKINLTVGPMAISGSTRMQASTVLMLAIGVGLLNNFDSKEAFGKFYQDFLRRLSQIDYTRMAPLTGLEAQIYQNHEYVNYISDPNLSISILTDTTERSPTFSLRGFENQQDPEKIHALSYLFIPSASDSTAAWNEMLKRYPRPLTWSELHGRIDLGKVLGFDISKQGLETRQAEVRTHDFVIKEIQGKVVFALNECKAEYMLGDDPLFNHLVVKMLLNAHSTLVMGLLGRYEGNIMTYVRPSNNKLIDRAARYCMELLRRSGKNVSYEKIVENIFEEMEIDDPRPVVLRVVEDN